MSFDIIPTTNIGFCFGVRRAIDSIYELLNSSACITKVYTWGEIVHNSLINTELTRRGVIVTENLDEIESGGIVFIRAHGVSKKIIDALRAKNVKIIDRTCPKVKRIHKIAAESDNLIVAGDIAHPEVIGIVGNAKNKFLKKNCDLLVVNDLFEEGAGFKTNTNKVALITKNFVDYLDLMSKDDLSDLILDKLIKVKGE